MEKEIKFIRKNRFHLNIELLIQQNQISLVIKITHRNNKTEFTYYISSTKYHQMLLCIYLNIIGHITNFE